jgi:PIN domain nuclease of toxin-antitoxin system
MSDPSLLNRDTIHVLTDYENVIFISSESVKEVIHLVQNERLKNKRLGKSKDIIETIENEFGFTIKYVNKEHLQTFASLDNVENHNDPSDRLIIAQAITEKLPLISSDRKFEHYRKQRLNFIYNKI